MTAAPDAATAARAALEDRQPEELAHDPGCSLAAVRAWRDGSIWRYEEAFRRKR